MTRWSERRPRPSPRRRFAPTLSGALERRVVPSGLTAAASPAAQAATATALTTSADPAPFNAGTTLTATVTAASGTPTGAVTFYDGTTALGTATLDAGGRANLFEDALIPGTHTLTASYGGDANDAPSTSPGLSQSVKKIDPFVNLSRTAAPAPAPAAGAYLFTFSAAVGVTTFDASPPPATGSVTFTQGANVLGSAPLARDATTGLTAATFTAKLPGPGSEQVRASYSGDPLYNPAVSPAPQAFVSDPTTTTTLVTSDNPSVDNFGTRFTATVAGNSTPPGSPVVPTGLVSFYDGTTLLGSAPIQGGQATFSARTLAPGTHQVTATYGGDSAYDPSTTTTSLTQVVTATQNTTLLSVSTENTPYGIPVMFSASVNYFLNPGAAAPTGTITFYDGQVVLASRPLGGPGGATFSTSALPAGTHAIRAAYSGDPNFTPSASQATTLTVNPVVTSVALAAPVVPTSPGQPVTLTAYVTPTPAGVQTPTGVVVFYEGTTRLGSAALSGGVATLPVPGLSLGTHAITADYAGDGNFLASSSAPARVPGGNANERFLNQLYLDLLRRPIDSGGLSGWEARLNAGVSRGAIALAIEGSREFALTTLTGLSRSILSQAPTASMVAQALTLQARGQSDPTALQAIVLNSPEFFRARAGVTPAGFVAAVSRAVTGQPPDPARYPALLALASRGNRAAVIAGVLTGPAGLSAQVVNDYAKYLGRTPQDGDVAYFVTQLQQNVSAAAVITQFVASPEYFRKAAALPSS